MFAGYSETVMIILCFVVVGAYHLYLMKQIKNDPAHTVFGFGKSVRRAWVAKIMSQDKHALLGVQTMRNELLIGQFLAQSSFVALSLVVGSASGSDLQSRINRWVRDDPIAGGDVAHISPVLRLALLGLILGSVFVNSVQALRLQRHISMYFGVKATEYTQKDIDNLLEHVAEKYELSNVYMWWAFRGMMLLFPAVALLFGVSYALLASCCSVIFLSVVDNLNMGEQKLFERASRHINKPITALFNMAVVARESFDGRERRASPAL